MVRIRENHNALDAGSKEISSQVGRAQTARARAVLQRASVRASVRAQVRDARAKIEKRVYGGANRAYDAHAHQREFRNRRVMEHSDAGERENP